jgi:G3E family GTPase
METGATIPLIVVTGFLGSGKTTLLNRILSRPGMSGTLAIINEFGEIGLDHLLVETSQERLVLLDNGCVCCTVRDDLIATLKDLALGRIAAGTAIDRVILETTGLADPAPILHALMVEAELAERFSIAAVITTVDAVNGAATLQTYAEARKQLATADHVILTKTDLADSTTVHAVQDWIVDLAPSATLSAGNRIDPSTLLQTGGDRRSEAMAFARSVDRLSRHSHDRSYTSANCDASHHDAVHPDIRTFAFVVEDPVEWASFRQWLDYFASIRGADLLRMKGLVQLAATPEQPMLLHGVQHVFDAPKKLDSWPSEDHRTRLVFIVKNISREMIETTLAKFAGIETRAVGTLSAAETEAVGTAG